MRPLFSIDAGEYLVGDYIESHFGDRCNVWIPSRDTGIDLLVTDHQNQRTASLQVKFGKDFLPGKSAALRNSLRCLSWFTLDRTKLHNSKADFWVFVLRGFTSDEPDFLIIPTTELMRRIAEIPGPAKAEIQVYFCSTKSKRCWETRKLRKDAMLQIANGTYEKPVQEFTKYLNEWAGLKAKLDH